MPEDPKRPVFKPPDDVLGPKESRRVIGFLIVVAITVIGMKIMGVGP